MGLSDKGEAVKEVKEAKEAKGEGVERVSADAHSDKALDALLDKKTGDFINQKTNIDQVKVGDKTVDLNDGKHEREKGAIKAAAQAMAKGNVEGLEKACKGLSPEQAKTVAAGLDKVLRPGGAVGYDGDNKPPTIDIYSNPARPGDSRSQKIMIPTDGEAPRRALGETPYEEASKKATAEDFKKVVGDAVKGEAARKDNGESLTPRIR